MSRNHHYAVTAEDGTVVAQRLRKADAEWIVWCIESLPRLRANNIALEKRLTDCERTVERLRAQIRMHEVNHLREIVHELI